MIIIIGVNAHEEFRLNSKKKIMQIYYSNIFTHEKFLNYLLVKSFTTLTIHIFILFI